MGKHSQVTGAQVGGERARGRQKELQGLDMVGNGSRLAFGIGAWKLFLGYVALTAAHYLNQVLKSNYDIPHTGLSTGATLYRTMRVSVP